MCACGCVVVCVCVGLVHAKPLDNTICVCLNARAILLMMK